MPVDNIYALTIGLKYAILIKNRARQSIVDPAPSSTREETMKLTPLVLALALALVTPIASAQTPAPCDTPTKGLPKEARKLLELKCELEQKQIRAQIAEVERKAKEADLVLAKEAARTVEATTTVDGKTASYSKTPSAAKFEEKMVKAAQPQVVAGYPYYSNMIVGNRMMVGSRYASPPPGLRQNIGYRPPPPPPGPRQNIGYRLPTGQAVKR